ncbi:hypothetical protein ACLB2K_039878 [Fragaria x ananassa]
MEAEKKPLKVGPFGSDSGGDRFDDGVHSSVSQLVIFSSPSSIRYIQIEYDDNGKSYWSQKHGYSSSLSLDKIESIKLDYPEEYLTSVHGYYKSTWSDEWFDLRALGAYLKPLVHTPQYSNNNISPAPVAHIGYPAAYDYTPPLQARPPPPYYGSYYTNPNHPPQAAPTPYPYGYYVPPPGPPPYNNGYYDYQMSQAPPPPPPAALGRPRKPKSAPGKPKAAKNNDPKNVSYRVLGNGVSGNTGDHNGVFNVGNKNIGLHKEDDEEDQGRP